MGREMLLALNPRLSHKIETDERIWLPTYAELQPKLDGRKRGQGGKGDMLLFRLFARSATGVEREFQAQPPPSSGTQYSIPSSVVGFRAGGFLAQPSAEAILRRRKRVRAIRPSAHDRPPASDLGWR